MSLRSAVIFGIGILWFVAGQLAYQPGPADYLGENFQLFQQIAYGASVAFIFVGLAFFLFDFVVYLRRRISS
jgi:hypothetical protein